jgi:hypothetical protein
MYKVLNAMSLEMNIIAIRILRYVDMGIITRPRLPPCLRNFKHCRF